MNRITFQTLLNKTARLKGVDPTDVGTAGDPVERGIVVDAIGCALQAAWEYYFWPEVMLTEQRFYRDPWAAGTAYGAGVEVYFAAGDPTWPYYRSLATTVAGESPTTAPSKWEQAETSFNPYVAWEQPSLNPIGRVRAVSMYDPRIVRASRGVSWEGDREGIRITRSPVPPFVWINHRQRTPEWKGDTYSGTSTYVAGDQMYFIGTGEEGDCWKCLATTTAAQSPITTPAKWERIPVLWPFRDYAPRMALADWLRSDQQRAQATVEEDRAQGYLSDEMLQIEGLSGQVRRYSGA